VTDPGEGKKYPLLAGVLRHCGADASERAIARMVSGEKGGLWALASACVRGASLSKRTTQPPGRSGIIEDVKKDSEKKHIELGLGQVQHALHHVKPRWKEKMSGEMKAIFAGNDEAMALLRRLGYLKPEDGPPFV